MITFGKWRAPVLVLLPMGVLVGLYAAGVVRLHYVAETQLSSKAGTVKRLTGQGGTPSAAVQDAEKASAALIKESLTKQKTGIQQKITGVQKRQNALSTNLRSWTQQQQTTLKGNKLAWTPEMGQLLGKLQARYRTLKENYPTHTDIPLLADQIKTLEARQRGKLSVNRAEVSQLGRRITEARVESGVLAARQKALSAAEKRLQSQWRVVKPATASRWPVDVPGWPIATGSTLGVFVLGFFLIRSGKTTNETIQTINTDKEDVKRVVAAEPIHLDLAAEEPETLPDDPQTRKAAELYERWLDLVKAVYVPGAEPPTDIWPQAEPLFKETADFLPEGHDVMTRYLARVVVPGDLFSHVARTVLMALIGAHEAGASAAQQQGMTFAALFHDLAVVPRPADCWHEIGSEVGRLSAGVLRKIPGISSSLLQMVEDILIAMDEYPMETWQNVPRSQQVASFAKLLGHIDRFDKVLQKQKTRLARRLAN
jgi:hypothetical protein